MQKNSTRTVLHPAFNDALFAYAGQAFRLFNDVLGLYGIDYLAIARIDKLGQLLIFSSLPALEFNLFATKAWSFDHLYHAKWYHDGAKTAWPLLYQDSHYAELYYLKQTRHHFLTTLAMASKDDENYYVYSFASRHVNSSANHLFIHEPDVLNSIGDYCQKRFIPLFNHIAT